MDATEIRRLTELAARAAVPGNTYFDAWHPAYDDGDSRRLQVALNMNLYITDTACYAEIHSDGDVPHVHAKERCTPETRREAARLAVLRAAAALGEQMETNP